MRHRRALLVAAVLTVTATNGAVAQDFNGYEQIAAGDYATAERTIEQQRRMFPTDIDLLANLAAIYARTGRADAARSLYAQIVALPDEALEQSGGRSVSAHALARDAMRRLPAAQISAR